MPRTIEDIVYERMCADCEEAHRCHNLCENCDEYEDRVNHLYDLMEKIKNIGKGKPTQEEIEKFWEEK